MPVEFKVYNAQGTSPFRVVWMKGKDLPLSLNHNREMTLQYIKRGEGESFINDHKCYFCRNSLLISRPNDVQRCIPTPGSLIEKICFVFPLAIVDGFLPHSFYLNLPHVLHLSEKEATRIRLLIQNVSDELIHKNKFWYEKIIYETKLILILLSRCRQQKAREPPRHPVLLKALNYIENNYRLNITIQSLSRQFYISGSRLSHIFKKEVGMGVKQYVIQRKIAEAKRMLNVKHHPKITSIANTLGFKNIGLFSRHFKKATGLTTSEYRHALLCD